MEPFLFWILAFPALAAAFDSLLAGQRHYRSVAEAMAARPAEWTPPVTLIVPVRGLEEGLADNIRSLLEQDYPDYEVLVAVGNAADAAIGEIGAMLEGRARLVVAGHGPAGAGEKINNLLAAVRAARPSSEVLAFADSDGRVTTGWLRALVAPLREADAGASTGYRWHFPDRGGFWSLMRSVWNSTIAGGFGAGRPHFAWGGAMAVRREIFERARVAEFWQGAVSDDYRLTQAIRAAGLEIRFAPGAMAASPGECTAGEFLSWAIRQMIITRVYAPRLWALGFVAHVAYCGAMALGGLLAAGGAWWAAPVVLAAIAPGMWRGQLRQRAARLQFPERAAWFDRYGWAYSWLALPVTWVWLYVFLASARTRRIEWRGYTYELLGPSNTRRI